MARGRLHRSRRQRLTANSHTMKTIKILVACSTLTVAGCDKNPFSVSRDVTYAVTGSGPADITYQAASDATAQGADQVLPWTRSLSGAKQGDFVYVSAQKGAGSGCITAAIRVNNDVFQSATSCGPFVIATASGTLK